MRVITVFKDELKRSSWVILIAIGCILLCNIEFIGSIRNNFFCLINGSRIMYPVNTVSWYLPVAFFLALSTCRNQKDDLWDSMPYTANELHTFRLAYGIGFIAIVGLCQLMVSAVIMHKFAFLSEDIGYLGYSISGAYNYPMFMLVNVGGYIVASTIYSLVSNRIAATAMLFFTSLMPELLITPLQWFCPYPQVIDNASEIKYLIAFGIAAGNTSVNHAVYAVAVPLYMTIIAIMLWLGYYVNKSNHSSGNSKTFYNKAVKLVFIVLSVLFALNIIEVLFLEGF